MNMGLYEKSKRPFVQAFLWRLHLQKVNVNNYYLTKIQGVLNQSLESLIFL